MENRRNYISIRFETSEMLQQALSDLIDQYNFFSCLEKAAAKTGVTAGQPVTYFQNEQMNILTFAWNLE